MTYTANITFMKYMPVNTEIMTSAATMNDEVVNEIKWERKKYSDNAFTLFFRNRQGNYNYNLTITKRFNILKALRRYVLHPANYSNSFLL